MNSIGRVIGCSDCDCDAPQPQRQAKQQARSHDPPSRLRNWDAGTHSGEDRFQIFTGIPGHRDPSFNLAHAVTKAKRFPIPQSYIPPLGATQPLAADLQQLSPTTRTQPSSCVTDPTAYPQRCGHTRKDRTQPLQKPCLKTTKSDGA